MKKKILLIIVSLIMMTTSASASWRLGDSLYRFNFDNSTIPSYKIVDGEWEIGNPFLKESLNINFEDEKSTFDIKRGIWQTVDGVYIQSEEGMSSTSRSILKNEYSNFEMSFDVTPRSDENTLMMYFGYENEAKYNSIEINSYQSKLIFSGKEYIGEGRILKDITYRIKLRVDNNKIYLYSDNNLIFNAQPENVNKGKIGIGTWNSKMEYDNFEIVEIPPLGTSNKMIGKSNKDGMLLFDEITEDNFSLSVKLASDDIYKGKIGVAFRMKDENNGYYAIIDKSSVYVLKNENGEKSVIKRESFKARSNKFYDFSIMCDGENISVKIDESEILSLEDDTFISGMVGFYNDSSLGYFEFVDIKRINDIYPPFISDGNTIYYVDSENGNDENDGMDENHPWKSINKLNQVAFKSGDKIILKGSFEDTFVLKNIACEKDNPLIITGGSINSSGCVLSIENCENITISDCELSLKHYGGIGNSKIGKGYGITLGNSEGIIISDCTLNGSGEDRDTVAIRMLDDVTYANTKLEGLLIDGFYVNDIVVNDITIKEESDGSSTHWAYKYLNNLKNRGIITELRPDDNVTRAEFSTMLILAMGYQESEYRGIFNDITEDMWYAKKMQTVSDYRIFPNEMTVGNLAHPTAELKREEAAAMSALALNLPFDDNILYDDNEECSEWSRKYIGAVSGAGIMLGKDDGRFYPEKSITRGEAAVILTKIIGYKEGK